MNFRTLFSLLLITALLALYSRCDKLPRNELLDGQWQLLRIDNTDLRAQRIYWRFQLDLLQFYSPHPLPIPQPHNAIMARFSQQGETLSVTQAFLVDRAAGRDVLITPAMNIDLSPLGITAPLPIVFHVNRLTSQTLRLTANGQCLEFRKF